ncbi:MAG: helix-turn-helix domain-containing protein [Micropruina glycogenica]
MKVGNTTDPDSSTAVPDERSIGAESLKAFAHPLRMALYDELGRRRSATASQLARALGESSGQTSYHLRQLERHGFVEDDPEHVGGRERWWRPIGFSLTDSGLIADPKTERAVGSVLRQVIAERAATLTGWAEHLDASLDVETGQLSSSTLDLTAAEAETLIGELMALARRYSAMARDREALAETRRYRVYLDVLPLSFDK